MKTPDSISHEKTIELLPWLVNGSLGASELEAVESHARSCVVCRRELESLQSLSHFVVGGAAAEAIPEPDMRNINARIDRLIEKQGRAGRLFSQLRYHFSNPWKLAFVAQAILVAGVTIALWLPETQEPEFTTLTQAQSVQGNHHLRVVFSQETTLAEVTQLLREFDLEVTTGPSARGVYTLSYPETFSPDERQQLIAQLQGRTMVEFAQQAVHQESANK